MMFEPDLRAVAPSRRSLLILCALAPVSALAACDRSPATREPVPAEPAEPAPPADPAGEQVKRVVAEIGRLSAAEPDLAGVRSLSGLSGALVAGLTPDDESLLTAALFLDARALLRGAAKPLDEAGVRAVLEKPIEVSRLDRALVERTLAEAKTRMAADREYAREVRLVFFNPFGANCFFNRISVSCSLAGLIGITVVRRWIDLQPI